MAEPVMKKLCAQTGRHGSKGRLRPRDVRNELILMKLRIG
jgi:hypothetical protein